MKKTACYLIFFAYMSPLLAQDSAEAREEGWPELNVYYNFNDKCRLFLMYSATKIRTSDFTDGAAGIYFDYFAYNSLRQKFTHNVLDSSKGYYLWLRGGYYYSTTPKNSIDPIKEHTIATEANSRFHIPKNFLLTVKNRFDWRTVNGVFKVRYRPRITIEKEMQTQYLQFIPYLYGEYFENFKESNLDRFRLCIGLEIKVALYVNFESYYLRQFEHGEDVRGVNAVGFAIKFYLSEEAMKYLFRKKKKNPA